MTAKLWMDISAWIYLNMCRNRQEAAFVFWMEKIKDKSRKIKKFVYISGACGVYVQHTKTLKFKCKNLNQKLIRYIVICQQKKA